MSSNVRRYIVPILAVLGVSVRLWFVLAANPHEHTFHSGGSDAPAYVTLATNLLAHRGYSYAGQPSAFRPPGYPVLVAAAMWVSPEHYISLIRAIQFVLGLLAVWICSRVALKLFGNQAARASLLIGLLLPTMIFSTAQILTECVATLLTALFLWFLVEQDAVAGAGSAAALGIIGGIESLFRFNASAVPVLAVFLVVMNPQKKRAVLRASFILLIPILILMPWLVRNKIVFGRFLLSTQVGANLVQGVISPDGRTQSGDSEKIGPTMGYRVSQLERESLRPLLPSELELNEQARRVVPGLWKDLGWRAVPLLAQKVLTFWLSLDQVLSTRAFSLKERVVRFSGVGCYWVALGLAIVGWFSLRRTRPVIAYWFLAYATILTILHLPLVMNTRLRIPLVEPLLVILAGIGWVRLFDRSALKKSIALAGGTESSESEILTGAAAVEPS